MSETKMSPRRQAAEDFAAWLLRVVVAVVGLTILVVFCLQVGWERIVPDLFPGAVAQGLVTPSLSEWTIFKVAGAVALLTGIWRYGFRRAPAGGAELLVLAAKLDVVLRHLGIDPEAAVGSEVAALAMAGKTVPAVALYCSATGADLAAATAHVEGLGRADGTSSGRA